MKENGLSEFEAQDLSQVSSINYGLTQHHPMMYLCQIAEEVKKIAVLRKKIRFDPLNSHSYEQEIWSLYTKITSLKEQYYEVKQSGIKPKIINAYVTFRDIQARNKMLELYHMGPIRRFFINLCTCFSDKLYPNMKLLNKGFYAVEGAVDPETILWENLGTPVAKKASRWTANLMVIIFVLAASYFGLWGISRFENLYKHVVKSDCSGNEYFKIDNAYADHLLEENDQQGLINCYCE
jgi:hypothetical protein